MILLIDNYDSFTYNLYQLLGELGAEVTVIRNDALSIPDIARLEPAGIILSPGPGRPEQAGVCEELVATLGRTIPLLGVCLGHQAICSAHGGRISYAQELMHGKPSLTTVDTTCPLFAGCEPRLEVARYHSLSVVEESLPTDFTVTARADDGEVMAVMHNTFPLYGVQFHPESIMTPAGHALLSNFLHLTQEHHHD